MLIVPFYRGIDWKHPPWVTIGLVLACTFVFLFIQGNENRHYGQALSFYFESQLPKLEFPAYIDYLRDQGKSKQADRYARLMKQDSRKQVLILLAIQRDPVFLPKLRSGQVINAESDHYQEWKSSRDKFDKLFSAVISESYGFRPAEHRPVTLVTHMFLHGGVGHLVGNMVFLFIIGFAVELILGRMVYLAAYIATGLFSVLLFWVFYSDSIIPLVGASGAISGLMGMYVVLFGMRRIRFFYFVLFYFNFLRAPAIIVLPLWILNELYQLTWGGVSNVAYVAHIGGLIGGAATAYVLKKYHPAVDTSYMDQSANEERDVLEFEQGMQALAALRMDQARKIFHDLLSRHPQDKRIAQQLYNIAKFKPDSDDYHQWALRILSQNATDAETLKMVNNTFHDYLKHAKPSIRLSTKHYLDLVHKFIKGDFLADAERIIGFLIKTKARHASLPQTIMTLANAFSRSKQTEKAKQYIKLLLQQFPQSNEAQHAQQLLRSLEGSA